MKKFNLLFFILFIIAFGVFTSCDKDDEINYDPELIGIWRTEITIDEITEVEIMTFREDLTGLISNYQKGEVDENPWPITYSIQGDKLSLTSLGYVNTSTVTYSVSGNKLHIESYGSSSIYDRL
jgi:hypothetical protein